MAQTRNLVGLAGVPFTMVLGNSMLIPVLPTIKGELGLTAFQTSMFITAFSVAAGLVIPFAGYLSDRVRRKKVIAIALSLYGLGGLLAGLAALWMDNPYLVMMVGRILQGVGAAGTSPIAMALVGDLFDGARESRALGLLETSNGLGKVLSPIFGSLLALIAWYMVLLAFPIICGLALVMLLFVKEKKAKQEPTPLPEYLASVKNVFRKHGRWLVPAFFIGSICLFTLFGVLFYLSDLLEERFKIDGVLKGGVLAIPLLALSITAYVTGSVIKKKLQLMKVLIVTGMFLLAGSYVAASFIENLYLLIGVLVAGSIGTGLILPCLNSMIIGAVKKSERGMITSLYNGVRFIGVAVGPPVFTWLLGFSRDVMFYAIAALTGLFGVIALFMITPKPRKNAGVNNRALSAMLEEGEGDDEQKTEGESDEAEPKQQVFDALGFDPKRPISTFLKRGKAR